jgi:hypothetical protein
MATEGRFQVHSGRTGHLEAVYRHFEGARRCAESLFAEFGESFFVVDLHQVLASRVVWNAQAVSPRARTYLDGLGAELARQGFSPNDWQA